ncbi:unnamed protein product [Adineta ricciae]|uniref:Uncharacterized protein n=1 Tax=Adineta ricciae TaxID=249248 RepID=A0A813QAZ5_ADIRI|nr:unnamed protein product [Adineta ricciae]CAF1071804.1 unnamed protein product [Adineta ricciae]
MTDVMNIPTGTSNSDDLSEQRFSNESELRDLVCQSLENDGILTRIKAELRAAVFKTIEKATNSTSINVRPTAYDGITGRICRALVLEWLEHSRLFYTEDVLKTETTGPNHPPPLTQAELLEQLHLKSTPSTPLLHVLVHQSQNPVKETVSTISALPDYIQQSIDRQFPNEKINDLSRLREHFRSLFSAAFDSTILDVFLTKHIPPSSTSFSKRDYEEICLQWMQACAKALVRQTNPPKQVSALVFTQVMNSKNTVDESTQRITQAARSMSPAQESKSASSASSSSSSPPPDNPRNNPFNFPLPTTIDKNKSTIKTIVDIIPPSLVNFDQESNNGEEDEEDDTSASFFSKRNATPAQLNSLKTIDHIVQGDITPRTRTTVQNPPNSGARNLPVEYDDESMSQSISHSIISSVDDITVDKTSANAANIDFLEDF